MKLNKEKKMTLTTEFQVFEITEDGKIKEPCFKIGQWHRDSMTSTFCTKAEAWGELRSYCERNKLSYFNNKFVILEIYRPELN